MATKMAEKNCGDPNYGIKWDDPPSKCEAMHPTWVSKKGYQWALQPWAETPELPQRGISIELSSSYPSCQVLEIVQHLGQKDFAAGLSFFQGGAAAMTSVLHWRQDVLHWHWWQKDDWRGAWIRNATCSPSRFAYLEQKTWYPKEQRTFAKGPCHLGCFQILMVGKCLEFQVGLWKWITKHGLFRGAQQLGVIFPKGGWERGLVAKKSQT